jgi:hypothetical protein
MSWWARLASSNHSAKRSRNPLLVGGVRSGCSVVVDGVCWAAARWGFAETTARNAATRQPLSTADARARWLATRCDRAWFRQVLTKSCMDCLRRIYNRRSHLSQVRRGAPSAVTSIAGKNEFLPYRCVQSAAHSAHAPQIFAGLTGVLDETASSAPTNRLRC